MLSVEKVASDTHGLLRSRLSIRVVLIENAAQILRRADGVLPMSSSFNPVHPVAVLVQFSLTPCSLILPLIAIHPLAMFAFSPFSYPCSHFYR